MKRIKIILLWWLIIPHTIVYLLSSQKGILNEDIDRWLLCTNSKWKPIIKNGFSCMGGGKILLIRLMGLCWLLLTYHEFRNVYYLRFRIAKVFLMYLPQLSSLHICTPSKEFGPGVYIQHGFATVITARHVGRNCWINQQVTVGFNDSKKYGYGKPWIGDDVRISAGAKVCGNIEIGSGSTIGMNAVVVKDVPENSTIVPSPMLYVVEKGIICKKQF